jgi:archaellum component FlaC
MESESTLILYKILNKLDDIDRRLGVIESDIEQIKKSNSNMDEHISFVEGVYDTIKNPFYYIMNKIKPIDSIPIKEPKQLRDVESIELN